MSSTNKKEKKKAVRIKMRLPSLTRFSVKEQTFFAKRMAFLVRAGVPMLESLHLIRKQTKSKAKIKIFDKVISDVSNGQFLATSLGRFGNLFGEFAINIIKVGESSGGLSQNLAYLADELHKKYILRKKVLGALVYPMFITVATLGITGILTAFIFPKILPIFASLNVTLPLTTRALIAISSFLRDWGLLSIVLIILFVITFYVVRFNFERVRLFTDRYLLKIPFAGPIARSYNLTNFARTLGLLLRSGVHLTEAMSITADTTRNLAYKKEMEKISEGIVKGESISRCLERRPDLFPNTLVHLITIGETTGNLSNTLTYLSEHYEGEVEDLTKNLSSSIEPVLMIIMGLLVGLIAVSVITPIYEITQHLQPK